MRLTRSPDISGINCSIAILISLFCLSCGGGSPSEPVKPDGTPEFLASISSVCAEDIAVKGDFLYLADGPGGLKVVDISQKSAPVVVKTIPVLYAIRVYIKGQFLYLCDCSDG